MNWNAIGAVGEWAGAVAVIITLIYLARQIHQQNSMSKFEAAQSVLDGFRDLTLTLSNNAGTNEIVRKGRWNPENLSDGELAQFQMYMRCYTVNVTKAYQAYTLGFISEDWWCATANEYLRAIEDTPGGALFRRSIGSDFHFLWKALEDVRDPDFILPDIDMGRREAS
jgi:hypothetical protein